MSAEPHQRRDGVDDRTTYRIDSDESPAEGVLEAVATATDRPVLPGERGGEALPPLYEAVDPEALDRLVRSLGDAQPDASVSFRYVGYEVTVRADGVVAVAPV